ncbi:hypothetical protein UlMin_024267 [Ulmus minor]
MKIDSEETMCEEYVEQATRNDMKLDELVLIVARTSVYYHNNFLVKQPCRNSPHTGWKFVKGILEGNDRRCHEMFRMEKHVFFKLCDTLRRYGLTSSKGVQLEEMIGMFLMILRHGVRTRVIEEQFQHSGKIMSRNFNQIPYIGRKGFPTQNIMTVCDFDMLFAFLWPRWEGSSHDSRIFFETLQNHDMKFPKPPLDKYYLVNAGYPNMKGYLAPYKGERYHLPIFRSSGQPKGEQETFNYVHSSLQSVIERCFGVWKARCQVPIVTASMTLHNFIRRSAITDIEFESHEENEDHVPNDDESYINPTNDDNEMGVVHDKITKEIVL